MESNYKQIAIAGLLAVCVSPLCAQQTQMLHNQQIMTETYVLKQKGDSLYANIDIDMRNLRVPSRRSLTLTPVLKSADGKSLDFPEVVVKGRNQYRQYKREYSLMSKEERRMQDAFSYAVLKNNKKTDGLTYIYAVPYTNWMANAKLYMKQDLCGCGKAPQELITEYVASVENIAVYEVVPYIAYVEANAEEIKSRDIENECFLDFVVNKTDIRQEYGNNPAELAKIRRMIDELKEDANLKVTALTVVGYASPEGSVESNKRLSEGRAKALVNYLSSHYDFPRDIYHVEFGGENWNGLVKLVEKSDMQYKDEVLDIIENVGIMDGREVQLMKLKGGIPYRYMLKEMFPSLRKALCKVNYEIKEFSLTEAREMIKTKPQLLSLNEMYLVANSYEKGSPEFNEVFEIASRMYPDDDTALLNAAASTLERRELISAEKYLAKIKTHSPEYNNCMGVLMMLQEDYNQAESFFKRAGGLVEASQNLLELQKKRDNMELLK
jgi:hypothetical protein